MARVALLLLGSLSLAMAFSPPARIPARSGARSLKAHAQLSHGGGIFRGPGNNNNMGGGSGGDGFWWRPEKNNGDDGENFDKNKLFMAGAASLPALLWEKYNDALDSQPLPTKAATSLTGFVVGDVLAQNFLGAKGSKFDYARLTRLASFGALFHGPVGHYFYGFLDSVFPGTETSTVALKVFIDQVLWAPIFTIIFFAYSELTAGRNIQAVINKVKRDLVVGVTASWKVWPIAHAINFRFIPSSQRLLYINTIQIGYNIFLSLLANR